ncbi:hypothetical protein [Thauera mechernichensis]
MVVLVVFVTLDSSWVMCGLLPMPAFLSRLSAGSACGKGGVKRYPLQAPGGEVKPPDSAHRPETAREAVFLRLCFQW